MYRYTYHYATMGTTQTLYTRVMSTPYRKLVDHTIYKTLIYIHYMLHVSFVASPRYIIHIDRYLHRKCL